MDSAYVLLEITLISAQDLPISAAVVGLQRRRRIHSYATVSGPTTPKLLTRVDRDGHVNPTWNDKFLLRLPAASLSSSAISVDVLATGGWCLPDSLLGSVRLLLSNHRLLDRPPDHPLFAAVGIRRPSGRFQGILNVGIMVLSRIPKLAAKALELRPAVSYRDLMGLDSSPLRESKKKQPQPQKIQPSASLQNLLIFPPR